MEKIVGIKSPFLNRFFFIRVESLPPMTTFIVVKNNKNYFVAEVVTKVLNSTSKNDYVEDFEFVGVAERSDIMLQIQNLKDNEGLKQLFIAGCLENDLKTDFIGTWISTDGYYVKFYYYSPQIIEFKNIIMYLVKHKKRARIKIELVQIYDRDYTANLGGFGVCGYELCCHTMLHKPPSITKEMVRYLGYKIGIKESIIGGCNDYKCCLSFEAEEYEQMHKVMPDFKEWVVYNDLDYRVKDINIYNGQIKIVNKKELIEVHYLDVVRSVDNGIDP